MNPIRNNILPKDQKMISSVIIKKSINKKPSKQKQAEQTDNMSDDLNNRDDSDPMMNSGKVTIEK